MAALGLYKYHLVVPFVLPLWRRKKLIAGFLSVATILGLISLAIVGWPSLLRYPGYLWGTEHNLKYGFNTLPGLTTNLRGLISGVIPAAHPEINNGLIVLLSAIVLLLMMFAAGKTSPAGSEGRRALFALGMVGTVLLSYHLYVHDLSLLFLAIVLALETLLSNPSIPKWTDNAVCLHRTPVLQPVVPRADVALWPVAADDDRFAGFLFRTAEPDQLSSRANWRNSITASIGR